MAPSAFEALGHKWNDTAKTFFTKLNASKNKATFIGKAVGGN